MARIKGPNGVVFEVSDSVAKGLVDSPSGEYSYVKDEPKSKPRSTSKTASSDKK